MSVYVRRRLLALGAVLAIAGAAAAAAAL
ncbi:MAG: hypothetical protein JWN32_2768, partial [Solirubrobacterales bacterium]|nr:hypothetical protein [Solirubrobacterales bacterium]